MFSKLPIKLLSALILLVSVSTFSPASGAGRTNQSVPNSVLNGKGAPTSKIGINGDFYIDILNFNIYGPKAKNRWPAAVSLRGPAGSDGRDGEKGSASTGADGSRGPKGDSGPQGLPGEKGEKGEKGDKGDPGERGATGEQGLVGATGLTGSQGLKGDKGDTGLTGAIGLTGAQGLKGDKGDTGLTGAVGATGATGAIGLTGPAGATGAQGPKGDKGDTGATGSTGATGATGETGPSAVSFVTIPTFSLSTGTPNVSAISSSFGSLEPTKSYKFELLVKGDSNQTTGVFGLAVNSSGTGNSINYTYTSSYIMEFRNNTQIRSYHFNVVGTILVGSLTSSLSVAITDGTATTQSYPMTINGFGIITLVGSVS